MMLEVMRMMTMKMNMERTILMMTVLMDIIGTQIYNKNENFSYFFLIFKVAMETIMTVKITTQPKLMKN